MSASSRQPQLILVSDGSEVVRTNGAEPFSLEPEPGGVFVINDWLVNISISMTAQ